MTFNNYEEFIDYLFHLKDEKYLEFNSKIVNTPSFMIGVRTPLLKQLVKSIDKEKLLPFLELLKGTYYEEVLIEGFIISRINDKEVFDFYFHNFVEKIDCWATCDMGIGSMKQLKKDEKYFNLAKKYIKSNKEFVARTGYIIMMDYFLDGNHIDEILTILSSSKESKYYYVNMAKAWLISVCYVKFKDKTLNFLLHSKLDTFTYNKAIQKIIESNRVSKIDKEYLKTLKRSTKMN